jgi:hypothetical protein
MKIQRKKLFLARLVSLRINPPMGTMGLEGSLSPSEEERTKETTDTYSANY